MVFVLGLSSQVFAFSEQTAPSPTPTCVAITDYFKITKTKMLPSIDGVNIDCITGTQDNGFIVLGGARQIGAEKECLYVAKFDSSANLQWEKFLGDKDETPKGNEIIESADGYVVAGNINEHPMITKIGSNGALLWYKIYFETGQEGDLTCLTKNSAGDIIAAGFIKSNMRRKLLVLKVGGKDGIIITSASYADEYGGKTGAVNIINSGDNKYLLSGYAYDNGLLCTIDEGLIVQNVTIITNGLQSFESHLVNEYAFKTRATGYSSVDGATIIRYPVITKSGHVYAFMDAFNPNGNIKCIIGPELKNIGSNYCSHDFTNSPIFKSDKELIVSNGSSLIEMDDGGKLIKGFNLLISKQITSFDIISLADGNILLMGKRYEHEKDYKEKFISMDQSRRFAIKLSSDFKRIW